MQRPCSADLALLPPPPLHRRLPPNGAPAHVVYQLIRDGKQPLSVWDAAWACFGAIFGSPVLSGIPTSAAAALNSSQHPCPTCTTTTLRCTVAVRKLDTIPSLNLASFVTTW